MRWAQPDFDDSHWRVISTLKRWGNQQVSRPRDLFWYRLHVKLPPEHGPLSLLFNYTGIPYEVYVNGKLVGQHGQLPPHARVDAALVRAFTIPASAAQGDLTIAIRFYCWWRWELRYIWGGLVGERGLVLGTARSIDDEYRVWQSETRYGWLPDFSVRFVSVLLAGSLLLLYRLQREKVEYLWIAAYFAAMTAYTFFEDLQSIAPFPVQPKSYIQNELTFISQFCMLQFVVTFLRQRMPLWLRVYQISLPFQVLLGVLFFAGWMSESAVDVASFVWGVPYAFVVPLLPLWRYLRGHKEAGILVLPLLLINLNDILNSLGWILYELRLRRTTDPFIPGFHIGPIPVYVGQIEGLLFVLSIGAILLYRFHSTSQDQARALAELEAARSMQEVMLPKQVDKTPGFAIEAVYVPAQEVGGDFFRLFPGIDGSLLVVIGDVSGKGVKAALLVSLTVGLLQKIVELTREPARVLRDLNASLAGHTDGRFATCCCALISSEGHLRMASAGHPSPYCDGKELEAPGGLPLGLVPDVLYEEIQLDLNPGARLVFLSDGVVEARSKSGELYGFERTRTISTQAADLIAIAAQRFGQEDDITVLGVELQPVPALA
jgi:phosphoserine phosphatase RsbU/P